MIFALFIQQPLLNRGALPYAPVTPQPLQPAIGSL